MKRLEWSKLALRQLTRLERSQQQRVRYALERFADTGVGDLKKLKGRQVDTWRLRIGDYRATFLERIETNQDGEFMSVIEIMYVLEVGHRREIYD